MFHNMTGKRIITQGREVVHRDAEETAAAGKPHRGPTGNWVQAEVGNKGGE